MKIDFDNISPQTENLLIDLFICNELVGGNYTYQDSRHRTMLNLGQLYKDEDGNVHLSEHNTKLARVLLMRKLAKDSLDV